MKNKMSFAGLMLATGIVALLIVVTPSSARADACQSCWLSLICEADPWGRTECYPYDGTHRCEEAGAYCVSDDAASLRGPEHITADGSVVGRTGQSPTPSRAIADDGGVASVDRHAGKQYTRGCGGVIVGRTFVPSVIAAVRRQSAVVIL